MSVSRQDLFKDIGLEPDGRGVALDKPILEEMPEPEAKPEEVEPKETQEEVAEGQESEPKEVSETVEETEEETQAEGPGEKLRAKEFADQAGWTLEEFYRDVTVPTDEGEVTLSEVVDGYKSLRAENETLRNERQQLEAKATQPAMQQYAPEAVDLMREADMLQKQYDAIQQDGTLDQMEAGESLKLDRKYRYEIDRRMKAAQEKQAEHVQKYEGQMREYLGKVNQQLRKDIPEWRSDKIRKEESDGMTEYLMSEGAEKATVDQILQMNPWAAKMFRKLWQHERKQAATKKALKEIKKVPRSLKPGAQATPKKPTLKEVGKKLQSAKSRREWGDTLLNADFDDALLK